MGAKLVWEEALWTLTGRPATWSRLRERLTGPRILRKDEVVTFPEGLSGTLAAADGDLFLRAERGQSEAEKITLSGGVECQGQGWRLVADTVIVTMGPERTVKLGACPGRRDAARPVGRRAGRGAGFGAGAQDRALARSRARQGDWIRMVSRTQRAASCVLIEP